MHIHITIGVAAAFMLTIIACGGEASPPADIDATVEAKVQAELATEATVEARVQEELAKAVPTATLVPTETSIPLPTSTPTQIPTQTPTPSRTPTPVPPTATPTPSPVPTPIPSPVLPSSASILKKSQGIMESLNSFQYEVEMGIKSGEFELPMGYKGRFKAPESLYSTLSANMFGLSITGDFIKIGDDYYEKEFMGEWASTGEFEGIDPREFWMGEDNLLSLPIASEPTRLDLEGVEVYKISWDLSDMGSGGPSAGILSLLDIAGDGMPSEMLVEYWIDADSSHLRKFAVSMEGDADDIDFSDLPIEADTVTITMEFHLTAFNEEIEPIVAPPGLIPTSIRKPTSTATSNPITLANEHYLKRNGRCDFGQYQKAIEKYTKAIELAPDVGVIYFMRVAAF